MFIDTHSHLDFPDYKEDREEVISRARTEGLDYIINVGASLEGSRTALSLAEKYDFVYAAIGIHPHQAGEVSHNELGELEKLAQSKKVVAIGETGLDYYKNLSSREAQEKLFRYSIKLARNLKLPLIIHSREAAEDTLRILKEEKGEECGGVLHCYSYPWLIAEHILHLGFYISVAGQITFPKAQDLREVVKRIPPERMMLETDCPFLAPQAVRGKRNEPAHIKYIARELSQIYGLTLADIGRITSLNAKKLFKLEEAPQDGVIAYPIRESLYLNITNRCTNECRFCVRFFSHFVKGHNLKLKKEPTAQEVLEAIEAYRGKFKEIVFCGLGEPMLRLEVIKEVSSVLKEKGIYVRLNTNGQANLIHGRNILPELKGLIDEISVSLNTENSALYDKFCPSQFGSGTYEKVKEFIREARCFIPLVSVTALDMPGVDMEACRRVAEEELGVKFRKRQYNVVG